MGNPQTGEELHLQSFSPRREGSEPHISLPRPAVLGQEYETPEHLSLKACGAYFWESQRAVGNRVSTFKGCTQKSHLLQDQGRSCHLPVAWGRPTCWSWRVSQRRRRQPQLILGTQTPAAAILGGVHSTTWTLLLASTILESSLQPISLRIQPHPGPPAHRQQYWDISGQATNLAGTKPRLQSERMP